MARPLAAQELTGPRSSRSENVKTASNHPGLSSDELVLAVLGPAGSRAASRILLAHPTRSAMRIPQSHAA